MCVNIHMRTNIELNDDLMAEARKYSKALTKSALVEEALTTFITVKAEERRRMTYKDRLERLRNKTREVKLASDSRVIIRQDRENR